VQRSGRASPLPTVGRGTRAAFRLDAFLADPQRYVEPFGGSSVVLWNFEAPTEYIYNDADPDLKHFFSVLRGQNEELLRVCALSPFSRGELKQAVEEPRPDDPLERARRFFVRATQTRTGLAQQASAGRWANSISTSRTRVCPVPSVG